MGQNPICVLKLHEIIISEMISLYNMFGGNCDY